jgi:hypothetical protein
VSQPGASTWQYSAWDQKDANAWQQLTKPPSWSREVQPAWAKLAAPQPSQLAQWIKSLEKNEPADEIAKMAKLMTGSEHVQRMSNIFKEADMDKMTKSMGSTDHIKEMYKVARVSDKMEEMMKLMNETPVKMAEKKRKEFVVGESLKGWENKYANDAGQPPATTENPDSEEEDDSELSAAATQKSARDNSKNLSSISHVSIYSVHSDN